LSSHSVAVVLILVQKQQIRININKRNNTKNTVQTIQNTVNTSTHITKTPAHYKTHTYTHPHLTKCIYTSSFNIKKILCSAHKAFTCFVWIWEQTAIISLYSINFSVFVTQAESVYCAVRTGSLNKAVCASSSKG
jgi:hypothetical protein